VVPEAVLTETASTSNSENEDFGRCVFCAVASTLFERSEFVEASKVCEQNLLSHPFMALRRRVSTIRQNFGRAPSQKKKILR
jgi:hypothetical protein